MDKTKTLYEQIRKSWPSHSFQDTGYICLTIKDIRIDLLITDNHEPSLSGKGSTQTSREVMSVSLSGKGSTQTSCDRGPSPDPTSAPSLATSREVMSVSLSGAAAEGSAKTSSTNSSSTSTLGAETVANCIEIIAEPNILSEAGVPDNTDYENVFTQLKKIEDFCTFRDARVAATARAVENDGYEGFDDETEEIDYSGMPTVTHDATRQLTILSWGKKHHKSAPTQSQFNINAGLLSGKKEGLDLRNMDGTCPEIQARIVRARMFHDITVKSIEKIEREKLSVISVNCTAGRHRSVAFAEILKKNYYPNATVIHVDL